MKKYLKTLSLERDLLNKWNIPQELLSYQTIIEPR
jgi:hypothetical protein